jgi:hypothetical protein
VTLRIAIRPEVIRGRENVLRVTRRGFLYERYIGFAVRVTAIAFGLTQSRVAHQKFKPHIG